MIIAHKISIMKLLIAALMLLPIVTTAQKANNWYVVVNNKLHTKGCATKVQYVDINNANLKTLAIKYTPLPSKKNWFTNIVVMDTNRVELANQPLTVKNSCTINVALFKDESGSNRPLNIYILQTPKDKKLAAVVRVAPLQLMQLRLQ